MPQTVHNSLTTDASASAPHAGPITKASPRPRAEGKFLFVGDEKLYIRGVTYGPFRPNEDEHEYHDQDTVTRDFAQMVANGINTVRLYTVPPRWLLDIAAAYGLRVLVGLPWEQHITYLDRRHTRTRNGIEDRVRQSVRRCAHHPALLAFVVGNEIPPSIARWYGRRRIERFIKRLYHAVKAEDPEALDWQIETIFAQGAAGMFAFAWTDEWHRGGHDIEDWDFGLTDRQRQPKQALSAVAQAYAQVPFRADRPWPRISVVVCTYNGARTLGETCGALQVIDYPDYEVIVVDDGSTDGSAHIARQYDVQLIQTPNSGLSHARNVGVNAATGSIVAYIDDDAYPDPHWLRYVAHMFMTTDHVGTAGPNISPPNDGLISQCVAHAPGGPQHVLLSDQVAEHIPGCNMAFRKDALEAIGGFDPQFCVAGDDVDVCWRLHERDGTLGFHPAAVVWHHRRDTVGAYLRQQRNYGKAEAMLETKWPQKYNHFGHVAWTGQIYGAGMTLPLVLRRWWVYHGVWGTQPFQSIYRATPGLLRSLPLMPEWYLVLVALLLVAVPGVLWSPLLLAVPLLLLAIGVPMVQAGISALGTSMRAPSLWARLKSRVMVSLLHLLQPVMRLEGRLLSGLTPWRRPRARRRAAPWPRRDAFWDEHWRAPEQRLASLEQALHQLGARAVRGSPYDRWGIEVRGGILGGMRTLMVIEEHGGGQQLVRLRAWPRLARSAGSFIFTFTALAALTVLYSFGAGIVLATVAVSIAVRGAGDCMAAASAYLEALYPSDAPRPDRTIATDADDNNAHHATEWRLE